MVSSGEWYPAEGALFNPRYWTDEEYLAAKKRYQGLVRRDLRPRSAAWREMRFLAETIILYEDRR